MLLYDFKIAFIKYNNKKNKPTAFFLNKKTASNYRGCFKMYRSRKLFLHNNKL